MCRKGFVAFWWQRPGSWRSWQSSSSLIQLHNRPYVHVCARACEYARAQLLGRDCVHVLSDVSLAALKPNTPVTEITLCVWFGFAFKASNLSSLCISGHINNCLPLSLPLLLHVCACLRVSLHFCLQYGAYVDVTYACLFVCVRLKIHTARRGGSFNYITYWDMPVTGLWSALPGFCIHSRAFS